MNYLLSMLNYNKWANEQTLQSLESANNPDAKAVSIFAHILNAEQIWLQRIKGMQSTKPWDEHTIEECRELMIKNADEMSEFLSWLRPDELKREIAYTDFQGNNWKVQLREIFVHLFNHATYHRGQIALLLRTGGNEPISTDYIINARVAD